MVKNFLDSSKTFVFKDIHLKVNNKKAHEEIKSWA